MNFAVTAEKSDGNSAISIDFPLILHAALK